MAFIEKNFSPIGGQARAGNAPTQWSFQSADDDLIDIQSFDYFNSVAFRLKAGDFISVIAKDGSAILTVESVVLSPNNNVVVISSDVFVPHPPLPPSENANSMIVFGASTVATNDTVQYLNPYAVNNIAVLSLQVGSIVIPRAGILKDLFVEHIFAGNGGEFGIHC